MDYVAFIRRFADRIFHVHMKDAAWNLGSEAGVFGGHVDFHRPECFWDFKSVGRGDIDFEKIIRALNDIGYAGPLSVEWEDGGMDREHGAEESCACVRDMDFPPSQVIFVFLARKSLCLYDVLLKLGTPPIQCCVVSDRVLDMQLEPFRDKHVALVDDTLILGTSLAKAKQTLEDAGARVSTHVFCLDQRWHCPSLIVPDSTAVETSDDRIMTFCTGEVRALSIVPRPYLVDFPLTRQFRLKTTELDCLLAQTGWTPFFCRHRAQRMPQEARRSRVRVSRVPRQKEQSATLSAALESLKSRLANGI